MNNIENSNNEHKHSIEDNSNQYSPTWLLESGDTMQVQFFEELSEGVEQTIGVPGVVQNGLPQSSDILLCSPEIAEDEVDASGLRPLTAEMYGEEFGEAYTILQPKLINYLMRDFRFPPEDAEQLAQDIHMRAMDKIASFNAERGAFSSWFFRLAHNMAIDQLRRDYRRPRIDSSHRSAQELLINVASSEEGVEHEVLSRMEARQLREALVLLGESAPEQRQAIEMAYLEGKTHSQIARALGLPIGTIKTRIRLGLVKMRGQLAGEKDLFLGEM